MKSDTLHLRGHKVVEATNFREDDPLLKAFAMRSPLGPFRRMTASDWVTKFTSTALSGRVPPQLHELHSIAKTTSAYGVLYYPLFLKGLEELYRTADAACKLFCERHGNGNGAFKLRIDRLRNHGIFTVNEHIQWLAFKELRNASSHATETTMQAPGDCLGLVREVTGAINRLYSTPMGDVTIG
jgi:hypothetical protein